MSVFLSYLRAAFTVSLITGISEKLAPARLSRYIEFLGGLILILFLFSPIKDLALSIPELFGDAIQREEMPPLTEAPSYDTLTTLTETQLETRIVKEINDAFSVEVHDVAVSVIYDRNGVFLMTEIKVILNLGTPEAIAEIEGYLTSRYHTAVFVSVMEEL